MSVMTRVLAGTGVVVMAAGSLLFAQGGDAAKVVADMRAALGGEAKLAAIKTISASGNAMRAQGETSVGGDYEMVAELPDKFYTRRVAAQTPMGNIVIKQGFNGDGMIMDTEQPSMPGGGMMLRFGGPGANATPEQQAESKKQQVETSKQEFARMALGMFGATPGSVPVQFTYAGTADAPDGKADILDVKGSGTFAGKLFVDQKSHLPIMFSWMGKEPIMVTAGGPGGGVQTITRSGGSMSQADMDKMMADAEARMKAAEANRKMVEFRVYYADFKTVDGVKLPHKFQQSVAGEASTEITIDKFKLNPKLDAKQFEIAK